MDISLNEKYLENHGKQYSNLQFNLLLEQLELLFFTKEGSVMGDCEFGVNLTKYLWEYNLSTVEIKQYIDNKIKKYIPFSKTWNIQSQVRFMELDNHKVAFVDVMIEEQPIFGVFIN